MRNRLILPLLITVGCQTVPESTPQDAADKKRPESKHEEAPAALTADARADLVEAAIRRTGEKSDLAGAATATFPKTIHLVRPNGDGSFTPIFQEVAFVHVVAGELASGLILYRVGLVANQVRIVVRGQPRSKRYDVVWESWGGELRRAGMPPSKWIVFDE